MKKLHRVIKFNQNAKTICFYERRSKKKSKNFEKYFFNFTNNAVFGKNMDNLRKNWYIKFVTAKRKRNYLAWMWITIFIVKNESFFGMKNTQILMNKPVYLGLSILELNKILLYLFWYDYVNPEYRGKAKLFYMGLFSLYTNIFFHCIHKNRWYLQIFCRRVWN